MILKIKNEIESHLFLFVSLGVRLQVCAHKRGGGKQNHTFTGSQMCNVIL